MTLLSFSSVMSTIGSVLIAVLILLVMITVHEFGHYIAGKALKFRINEFAIGFGPGLFRHTSKKTGEVFSVRLLPLGGFCAFEGEDGDEDEENEISENAFTRKAPWKRIIVLLAGPLMNYVLAVFLIIISMFAFGQMVFRVDGIVTEDVPQQYLEYSLEDGDLILQAEGTRIYLTSDFASALNGRKEGEKVNFLVFRDGAEKEIEVMLRADCSFRNSADVSGLWKALGVDINESNYYKLSIENYRFGFWETLGRSFAYSGRIAGTIFKVLGELLTGNLGLNAMGGPVTTIKLTSRIATQSWQNFFEIAAYIGVNLAVFNLLPIPALDGSKIVFCLIEWIFRKPVPRKIEAIIHAVGFVLILAFAVILDVLQFV